MQNKTDIMAEIETDVVVVGAGAGGAAVSWRLASRGVSVVCLEQGGWVDAAASAPAADPAWEVLRQHGWSPSPNQRAGPDDDPIDDADSEIKPLCYNGVGGSTVMWSCHMPRFHPSDFRVRTLDGVGADWPLGYDDLAPYYDLNETMMGVAGVAGHPAYPSTAAPRLPPVGLSRGARQIAEAMNRLGISWWPAEIAINTGPARGTIGQCNNCGPCELHCSRRAKGAVDLGYWPAALTHGVRLVTRARVQQVLVNAQGNACGVVWRADDGALHRVRAARVILAANGIFTPRLLLLSASQAHPDGLANRSGLVGAGLMLHPLARVTGLFDTLTEGHRGIAAGALVSHHFYETDPARGFERGIKLQALGTHGPVLTALGSLGARLPWGSDHHAAFARSFGRAISLSICAEDMPEGENRVVLSDKVMARDGQPAAKMVYRIPNLARAALDFGRIRAREILTEAGAGDFIEMPTVTNAGFHLMGTARMGADRETSVVDHRGQAHDVPGLYVADASVFASSAAVNPTNTLQALALRLADGLVDRLGAAS